VVLMKPYKSLVIPKRRLAVEESGVCRQRISRKQIADSSLRFGMTKPGGVWPQIRVLGIVAIA
jgi:hypothetical protein